MVVLLLVAVLVALAARRFRLPYTVGLVITGIALAASHLAYGAALTRDLIFDFLLPPLLFEAALNIRWSELRRDLLPVLALSTIGVVVSAGFAAAALRLLGHWPLDAALLFGVLIAATDPVAVIALCKDLGVKGRLRLLIEAESLFNDGTAAVLFAFALSWITAHGGALDPAAAVRSICLIGGGGMAIGLAAGGIATVLAGRTADYLVETALTALAAFGSFRLAEHFHASGILATVCAGLVMGNVGVLRGDQGALTARGREVVIAFWDFAAFVANSLIFLLMGLTLAKISFPKLGWPVLAVTIGITLLGRAATVYPICLLFARGPKAIPMPYQHVLFWGGLRGALALALALSLPQDLPARDMIIISTFGVVAFSVLVQGITTPILFRRLGLAADIGQPLKKG